MPKKNKKTNRQTLIPADKISNEFQEIVKEKKIIFSFDFFDRNHELFNLGDHKLNPQSVEKGWFLDFLDCIRAISKLTRNEVKLNTTYDLHPIDWKSKNINTCCPTGAEQYEWWQFRINKSKGRIIGIFIENCFHIVWLDRHHNLTNSDGYEKEVYYTRPPSLYENNERELESAYSKIKELEEEIKCYEELLGNNKV